MLEADLFEDLNIEINTSCNRRCSYCPNSQSERGLIRNERLMDLSLYHKIIDELSAIDFKGRISPHFYGEPLLDQRLTALIGYARGKLPDSELVIYSNGDRLSVKKFNELINAGVDKFIITLHGKSMSDDMRSLYNHCVKSPETAKKILWYTFNSQTPLFNRGGMVKPETLQTIPRCAQKRNPVCIDYSGNVVLCCNDYFSTVIFGNFKNQRLMDIWQDERYVRMRKQLKNKQYTLPICLRCTGRVGCP